MYYVSYGIACAIMFMYDLFVCPWGEELGAHNWRPIKSLYPKALMCPSYPMGQHRKPIQKAKQVKPTIDI